MFINNKKKFKNHYDAEAKQYDIHRINCNCNVMYDEILKDVIYSYIKKSNYILEAGCGTGRFSIYSAQRGKKIVALDASLEMLRIAREKAIKENVEGNIDFVAGDIENLPFKDKAFDGVQSFAVLRHFHFPENCIYELSRIVKDDGDMIIDFLNKNIFKYYEFYRKARKMPNVFNENFFTNYYLKLEEMDAILLKAQIKIISHRDLIKFPSHFILCQLKLNILNNIIKILEKQINFGAIIIIHGKKK